MKAQEAKTGTQIGEGQKTGEGKRARSRIKSKSYAEMFEEVKSKGEGAFIPFVVAGDPNFETSIQIVKKLVEGGADALEIGFTFSDPVADGPTVQSADIRAFKAGMTTKKGFEFVKKLRKFTNIPVGLLVYYNLIYKMGIEEFYKNAAESGVNGVLAADLPPEEAGDAVVAAKKYGVDPIFLAAQTTSNDRLKQIVDMCSGFLYVVSVMGVTGARSEVKTSTVELIERMRGHTDTPLCVGFGISKPEHVAEVIKAGSDGAIVGSALIRVIEENLNDLAFMKEKIKDSCSKLKEATRR
jgi:tryptophan synthase alpha chain